MFESPRGSFRRVAGDNRIDERGLAGSLGGHRAGEASGLEYARRNIKIMAHFGSRFSGLEWDSGV